MGIQGSKSRPIQYRQREFMIGFAPNPPTLRPSLWAIFGGEGYDEFVAMWSEMATWYFMHTDLKAQAFYVAGVSRWQGQRYINQRRPVPVSVANTLMEFYYAHV